MKTLCVLQHVRSGISRPAGGSFRRPQYSLPLLPAVHARARDSRARRRISTVSFFSAPGRRASSAANLIPSLGAELRLTQDFLDHGACPSSASASALASSAAAAGGRGRRSTAALHASTMPDASFPRRSERPFAADFSGRGLYARSSGFAARRQGFGRRSRETSRSLFQIGDNCFGFVGHPGIKSAMIEDLIMEFDEVPEGTAETLAAFARRAEPISPPPWLRSWSA